MGKSINAENKLYFYQVSNIPCALMLTSYEGDGCDSPPSSLSGYTALPLGTVKLLTFFFLYNFLPIPRMYTKKYIFVVHVYKCAFFALFIPHFLP